MKTVVAMFENRSDAEAAASSLASKGFQQDRLHVDASELKNQSRKPGLLERLFGMHKDDAEIYAEGVRRGNAVLGVECGDDEVNLVESTLEQHGPIDIETRSEAWRQHGWSGYDPSAPMLTGSEAEREREMIRDVEQRLPISEERLRVGKEAFRTGGVHIRSYVEQVPVSQDIELTSEHVSVERRAATGDAEAGFEERSIEVETFSEEPVVQKEARVVEEVVVKKGVDTRKETVKDTVRRTQIEVDDESKRNPEGR